MAKTLKKFSSQASKETLAKLHVITEKNHRKFRDIVEEAFVDLIDKYEQGKPRKHVMEAFQESLRTFDSLYDKLSK